MWSMADYIAANFDKRLKINELADRIGVNRSYLTSSFKKASDARRRNIL